jgi:hypothetical protein
VAGQLARQLSSDTLGGCKVSDDEYLAASASEHTLDEYPCGVRAGERLRLKRDLELLDHEGRPTRGVIPAGSIWLVLAGIPREPDVVWLQEPSGREHTWDETVLDDFERIDPDAA